MNCEHLMIAAFVVMLIAVAFMAMAWRYNRDLSKENHHLFNRHKDTQHALALYLNEKYPDGGFLPGHIGKVAIINGMAFDGESWSYEQWST